MPKSAKSKKSAKKTPAKGKSKKTAPPALHPDQLAIAVGTQLYRVCAFGSTHLVEARTVRQAGKVGLVMDAAYTGRNNMPIPRASVGIGEVHTTRIGALDGALAVANAALLNAEEAYDKAETAVAELEQLHEKLLAEADSEVAKAIAEAAPTGFDAEVVPTPVGPCDPDVCDATCPGLTPDEVASAQAIAARTFPPEVGASTESI